MEKIKACTITRLFTYSILTRLSVFLAIMMACNLSMAQNNPLYYSNGEDLEKKTANFLFLKIETDKKEAFVGESIVAWYYLYVAVDIQAKLSKSPSFTGFASYDMEGADTEAYQVKKIKGIPYRVYQVKQVQLFGLRPGIQRLEPVELEATIRYRKVPKEINDYLSGSQPIDTLFNYTMKSTPINFKINALPKDPTGSFTGAVGEFELTAFASATKLSAGKADTLHVILRGKGNWHEVTIPTVKWPPGIEIFEPHNTENINPYSIPVEGLRTLAYPLVFNKPGKYLIPGPSFTYFNPVIQQYKTLQTDSIPIVITKGSPSFGGKPKEISSSYTALFSRFAIIIFPVIALGLLGMLFFRGKKQ